MVLDVFLPFLVVVNVFSLRRAVLYTAFMVFSLPETLVKTLARNLVKKLTKNLAKICSNFRGGRGYGFRCIFHVVCGF